jgi:hypothetical protein
MAVVSFGRRSVANTNANGERQNLSWTRSQGMSIRALSNAMTCKSPSNEYRKALKSTGERLTIAKQILAREEARASDPP